MEIKTIKQPDNKVINIIGQQNIRDDFIYVPSQFTIPFEYKGEKYIFNTLTRHVIQVDEDLPESCRYNKGYNELIRHYFLVPKGQQEYILYEKVEKRLKQKAVREKCDTYTILPTLACNAKCVYCYEEGMKQVTMTDDIIERTIHYIVDTRAEGTIKIGWFGGEPLLCPHIIDKICQSLTDLGIKYTNTIISNSSLITDDIIDKMTGLWNIKHIQVSMDGIEKDYIERKRYNNYDDYYWKIIKNINKMSENGINVDIRCVLDYGNYKNTNLFLKDLENGIINKKNVGVGFATTHQMKNDISDDGEIDRFIYNLHDDIINAGFKTVPRLRTNLKSLFCMGETNNPVITPDGGLYPCEHCPEEARYGDVFHGITDLNAKNKFCNNNVIRDECKKCCWLPDCMSFQSCPVHDTNCKMIKDLVIPDLGEILIDNIK